MFISIVIPFYNAEDYLLDCIKSVFAQTHKDWELILIDDGSKDKSLAIAQSIDDDRVRVYSDGQNKKLAARLNEIVDLVKYDLVARMDADDLMSPTRIEKQLKIIQNNPNIDLVSTGLYSMTNEKKITGFRFHPTSKITIHDLLRKNGCGVVHASIVARKDWLKRNPYDESMKIAQDYDLWLRSSKNNDFNIFLIGEPLYYYREEGSLNPKKMLLAYRNERKMYWKYYKKEAFYLISKSFFKSIIVRILSSIGKFNILINRRSQVIDDNVKNITDDEIKQILSTEIPLKTPNE